MTKGRETETILVTGATGYVGGRFVEHLLAAGYRVRAAARSMKKLKDRTWSDDPKIELIEADLLEPLSLKEAFSGCQAAYYLVHSMNPQQKKEFARADRLAAVNFVQAASGSALERIIYLGGLGGDRPDSSPHLKSRLEVAQILACGTVPVTSLFAAMILGSGSTSFEIMRYLVERLPVMIVPSSVINSRIQPISIKNVINYLAGCLENKETMGRSFDIGGPDVITYRELLEIYAIEKGVRRPLIISPRIIANSSIATRFVFFIARHVLPVPPSISHPLLEGAKNEAIVRENSVRELIPQRLIPCGEAIGWAIKRDSQQIVKTRWTDAGVIKPPEWAQRGDAPYAGGTLLQGGFRIWLKALPEEIWPVIRKMGGNNGYYYGDILWQIRGWMDSMAGGAGLRRGRRDPEYIRVGDALDFWRVLDVDAPERLILLAEMKLPGEAILDISIIRHGNRSELRFGTRFRPKGLYGIFYWYLLKPAHDLLFRGMLRAIAKKIDCQVLKGPEKFKPGPIW